MNSMRCQVAILGGGPAGSAAGTELARRGLSTVILERSRCARHGISETLSPEATTWLDRLGFLEPLKSVAHIRSPGVVSHWGTQSPIETDFAFRPDGFGQHVGRHQFDAALAAAATKAGALFIRGAFLQSFVRNESGWQLQATADGKSISIASNWVIDATGRGAWFVRRQGIRPIGLDRLIAIVASVDPGQFKDQRLFVEAVSQGWWYFAPSPGEGGAVAFLTDADLAPRDANALGAMLEAKWAESRLMSGLFRWSAKAAIRQTIAANFSWSPTVTGPRWLAIGDAAMAHDPLSGSGLGFGLASGWHAAQSLIKAIQDDSGVADSYQKWAEYEFHHYRLRYAQVYGQVTTWPDSPFWRRRSQAKDPIHPAVPREILDSQWNRQHRA